MHSRFILIIITLALMLCPFAAEAQTHSRHSQRSNHSTASKKKNYAPARHITFAGNNAPSYSDIVIDAKTGLILHSTNPDSSRHPASLTKMMVLYIAFQALESGQLRLDQLLPISAKASVQSPSKLGLKPGGTILVKDAIMGMVTESANDAAVVMAEALGGGSTSNFATLMTMQAHALGMTHTQFDNPSGLPDANLATQITTARDMAKLGLALIYHYPNFYTYFSHETFVYNGVTYHNHNHLMERYPGMDGIKTGYIQASGFNLVASAVHNNRRLVGVVFGGRSAPSRDNQMAALLDAAFATAPQQNSQPVSASGDDASSGDAVASTDTVDNSSSSSNSSSDSATYLGIPAKISVVFTPGNGRVITLSRAPAPRSKHGKISTGSGGKGNWGVQVGAYSNAQAGRRELAHLINTNPALLSHAKPVVQAVHSRRHHHLAYRARLMGLDKKTALSVCNRLVVQGHSCIPIKPHGKAANTATV